MHTLTCLCFVLLCSYYMEILHQEYYGAAGFNLALFQEQSSFTEEQTDDAVDEVQNIIAQYKVSDEEQVCSSYTQPYSFYSETLFFVPTGFNDIKHLSVSSEPAVT